MGQRERVADYCRRDVEILCQLFDHAVRDGHLIFRTKTGERVRLPARWDVAELVETAWQQSGFDDVSWDAWLAAAELPRPARPRPRLFEHEHYVVQAGLASQGLVLASSLLMGDLVARGWLEPYRPDIQLAGRRYTALSTASRAALRKVSSFLEWLEEEAADGALPGRRPTRG